MAEALVTVKMRPSDFDKVIAALLEQRDRYRAMRHQAAPPRERTEAHKAADELDRLIEQLS